MDVEGRNGAAAAFISMTVKVTSTYVEMPARERLELTSVLHALSDPVRLRIVAELAAGGEHVCGTLELPVSDSTRSHHLRILREAGVTATRIAGKKRLVSLRRADLEARFPRLLDSVLSAQASRSAGADSGEADVER